MEPFRRRAPFLVVFVTKVKPLNYLLAPLLERWLVYRFIQAIGGTVSLFDAKTTFIPSPVIENRHSLAELLMSGPRLTGVDRMMVVTERH